MKNNKLLTTITPVKKIKILLIEHTCEEFVISRLKLGVFLINKGFEVYALVPEGGDSVHYNNIKSNRIHLLTYPYKRNETNLVSAIKKVCLFKNIFQQYQFDLIHSFKFQPNFYASLANVFSKKTYLVLHITGLGIVFTNQTTLKFRVLKFLSRIIFSFNFLVANQIIFQNKEDQKDLWFASFFKKKYSIIEGSGVDVEKFDKTKYDISSIREKFEVFENQFIITFISRLVWQKGVKEITEAVEILSKSFPNLKALIIGESDANNPQAVTKAFLAKYTESKNITFLGHRNDIAELLAISQLYVYPSYYREGVPRTALEAMATGLPIITTQMPGCNLCVEEGENGYLVEPMSTDALSQTLQKALCSNNLLEMGKKSRALALAKFQNSIIYQKILKAYPL